MKMTIFLVGSMGVGKSLIGNRLATKLKMPFIDTDEMLVAQQGLSINEIFSLHGESHFRMIESRLLREIDLTKSQLIATGGGLPLTGENMVYMKAHGVVVFLKDDLDAIAARLYQGRDKRPTIKDLDMAQIKHSLEIMLADRTPIYELAHLTFLRSDDLGRDVDQLGTYLKIFLV